MKEAEKWQIRRFLELLEDAPSGVLEHPNPPDAVITTDDSCVAIEHTRVLRPSSPGNNLRAFEKRTDDIAAKARDAFESENSDVLRTILHFDERVQLTKADEDEIARAIAEVVAAYTPPVGKDWRLESWWFRAKEKPFPRAIETIWIHNVPEWGALWRVARSTTVPDLTPETVQQSIDTKEAKLDSYREACEEVWLLLVIEGFAPSSHWGLERFPADYQFDFSFNRVFLYHQFGAEIQELQRRPIRNQQSPKS